MKTKKCSKCEAEKLLTEKFFYKHSTCITGFHTLCIECCKENGRENRKDPVKRETARQRASQHWHAKPYKERSEICNERRLMQRFKRTPEWYEETLKNQGGHCALCDAVPTAKRLHVDHDHKCCKGRITCGVCIRGLLCSACNTALGHLEKIYNECFEISPNEDSWTDKALRYLDSYRD